MKKQRHMFLEDLPAFKVAYEQAVALNQTSFTFQKMEFLVTFAKYVIESLEEE